MTFKQLNNRLGWLIFGIATLVYFMTLERTVSLWDCGEYISTSYKLEVGHPPGAPLFMMLGRLFSFLAGPESVALCINVMSALSSSFAILFLFWTITLIGGKIAHEMKMRASNDYTLKRDESSLSPGERWAILLSGVIGALAYTFTDSFWFSAVEAEVYAMSSFFTAIVIWAIFKWERIANEPKADKWLIFVAFLTGLAIGVHLLNLLAIPALAFTYYFKRFSKPTPLGFIITGIISLATLFIIMEGIIPKTIGYAAQFEIYSVNQLGLPFHVGTIIVGLILTAAIAGGIIYAYKKGKVNLHTSLIALMMIYVGYSSFTMIPVRSNANLPIDENNPEDLVSLNAYLLREQYGDWPLTYGPYWNSIQGQRSDFKDRSNVYVQAYVVQVSDSDIKAFKNKEDAEAYAEKVRGTVKQKYYMSNDRSKSKPTYTAETSTYFPRMYSSDSKHVRQYIAWSGYTTEGKEAIYHPNDRERTKPIYLPNFSENISYFLNYQITHMYFRYFMWNFSGRQNDEQNYDGNLMDGNWITGIDFIDSERLGSQKNLPDHMRNNPSNNKFYMLPLILGLIGFFYTAIRSPKDWFVIFLLFTLTGIAIVVYLNQKPMEPRERDYAYAGSTYAFAIWIGLGVWALYDLARKMSFKQFGVIAGYALAMGLVVYLAETINGGTHALSYSIIYIAAVTFILWALVKGALTATKDDMKSALAAGAICLIVPGVLAKAGWDDHDRSGRETARELAKNYLRGCDENGIIFTNGDNDTFPLWYLQEVEGFRTDMRVVNLSLLNTDWYIVQAMRKYYLSESLPVSFTVDEIREGNGRTPIILMPDAAYSIYQNKAYMSMPSDQNDKRMLQYLQQYKGKAMDIRDAMKFIQDKYGEDNFLNVPQEMGIGEKTYYLPTNEFYLPVDKQKVIAKGVVSKDQEHLIVDTIRWTVNETFVYPSSLVILDLVAHSDWERPLYWANTGGSEAYVGLDEYLQMEGMVYRFVPIKGGTRSRYLSPGSVNTTKSYDIIMNQFEWGGLNRPGVTLDYYTRRPIVNFRRMYLSLADALLTEGKFDQAKEVLDRSEEEFPLSLISADFNAPYMVDVYLKLKAGFETQGKKSEAAECVEMANKITDALLKIQQQTADYIFDKKFDFFTDGHMVAQLGMSYSLVATLNEIVGDNDEGISAKSAEVMYHIRNNTLKKWSECLDYIGEISNDSKKERKTKAFYNSEFVDMMEGFLLGLSDIYWNARQKNMEIEPGEFYKTLQTSTNPEMISLRGEIDEMKAQKATYIFVRAVYQRHSSNAEKDRKSMLIVSMIQDLFPEVL